MAGSVDQFESGLAGGINALAVGQLGSSRAGGLDALVSLGDGTLRAADQGALVGNSIEAESLRAADSGAGISNQLESFGTSRDLEAFTFLLDGSGWAGTFANTVLEGGASWAANGEALLASEDLSSRAASSDAVAVDHLEVFIAGNSGADSLDQGEVLFAGSNAIVFALDETVWARLDDALVVDDLLEFAWALGSDALLSGEGEVFWAASSLASDTISGEVLRAFNLSASFTNLGPASRAAHELAFVVGNLVSRLASDGGAATIGVLDGTFRAGGNLVAETILELETSLAGGSSAVTISVSGESSAALFLDALSVGPDLVAGFARNLEALAILEGESWVAADSNALVGLLVKLEAIAASFSDASAVAVVFPASLAIDDAEFSFESASGRARCSLADAFLGGVVHVALRLAALAVLESPAIRASDSDASTVGQSEVLRAGQQDAFLVSEGVAVSTLASDALLSFQSEICRAADSDALVADLLVVLGALLGLEAFSVLEDVLSRAANSGAFLVAGQGEVLRALVSDALVLSLGVDVLAIAVNLEALSILQFESGSARDSGAFSVDELEAIGTAGSDALVTLGCESFGAVAQADSVGESLSSRA